MELSIEVNSVIKFVPVSLKCLRLTPQNKRKRNANVSNDILFKFASIGTQSTQCYPKVSTYDWLSLEQVITAITPNSKINPLTWCPCQKKNGNNDIDNYRQQYENLMKFLWLNEKQEQGRDHETHTHENNTIQRIDKHNLLIGIVRCIPKPNKFELLPSSHTKPILDDQIQSITRRNGSCVMVCCNGRCWHNKFSVSPQT